MKRQIALTFPLILAVAACAQTLQPPPPSTPPPPANPPPPQLKPRLVPGKVMMRPRVALGDLEAGPRGRWWTNPETAKEIGLTTDQQKKMDDIFHQHRLSLIDMNAALEKAEVQLEPLVAADQPDEGRILAQIDRVAQARADLEKANARMLLGIRRVLTADQWQKLKVLPQQPRVAQPPPGAAPVGRRGGAPPPRPPVF